MTLSNTAGTQLNTKLFCNKIYKFFIFNNFSINGFSVLKATNEKMAKFIAKHFKRKECNQFVLKMNKTTDDVKLVISYCL